MVYTNTYIHDWALSVIILTAQVSVYWILPPSQRTHKHALKTVTLAEVFVEIISPTNATTTFQCSSGCVNGSCIPPGLCACNTGWRGAACDVGKFSMLPNQRGSPLLYSDII